MGGATAAIADYMDHMASLIEDLSAELRKHWKPASSTGKGSFTEPILAFIHAVDWTEPWLSVILASHIILLLLAIGTRKNNAIQMGLFLFSGFCIFIAERLNTLLSRNWTSFSRQHYFDHHGVFMSVLWSGPFLLIVMVILVNNLITLASLIVKWKRAELRHRIQKVDHKEE